MSRHENSNKIIEVELEIHHRVVKEIKDDTLNLEGAVVKETRDNTRKDEEMMKGWDLEIGEMKIF